jgi:uncharacterized protein (DUF1684 family)
MELSKIKIKGIGVIAILVVLFVILFPFDHESGQDDYILQIEKHRAEIDAFMRKAEKSPFNGAAEAYHGLNYYAPDPAYRITARFVPLETEIPVSLATSDGKSAEYFKYGYVHFDLNGRANKLLILKQIVSGEKYLFIPFADSTSGEETYGGGRYLETEVLPDSTVVIDFNLAYNPYCAYSPDYSCPLPPVDNYLAIAIAAGEKNYK